MKLLTNSQTSMAAPGMDKWFHPKFYWVYDFLSMLGLELIPVDKKGSPLNLVSKHNVTTGDADIC